MPVQFSQKHNPFLPRGAPCGDAFGGATFGSPLSSPPGSPSMATRQVRAQDSAFLTPPGTPDLHASLNLSATSSASYADSPHAMPLMREGGALGLMKKAPLPSKTASPPGNVEEDDIAGILGALSLSSDAVHPASPEVLPPDAPHTDAVALFTPSGSPASCPYKVFSLSATSCIEDRLCATDWRFILSPLCLAYRILIIVIIVCLSKATRVCVRPRRHLVASAVVTGCRGLRGSLRLAAGGLHTHRQLSHVRISQRRGGWNRGTRRGLRRGKVAYANAAGGNSLGTVNHAHDTEWRRNDNDPNKPLDNPSFANWARIVSLANIPKCIFCLRQRLCCLCRVTFGPEHIASGNWLHSFTKTSASPILIHEGCRSAVDALSADAAYRDSHLPTPCDTPIQEFCRQGRYICLGTTSWRP